MTKKLNLSLPKKILQVRDEKKDEKKTNKREEKKISALSKTKDFENNSENSKKIISLKPKEQVPINLVFHPSFRIAPFKYPLGAQCLQTSEQVHLTTICGECHATEIKLSEHSILFPLVVVGDGTLPPDLLV